MANLTPTAGWDNVTRLETTTVAQGGPGGPMNLQAQALLNRTEALASEDAGKGASIVGNAVVAVDSVAALRDLPVPSKKCSVYLRGYYQPDDGGGGLLVWKPTSSKTDNGGTVFTPNSAPANGRWERGHGGAVNVLWFGAKGDNATDDTAAFNSATGASVAWSSALEYNILAPSDGGARKYKLNGTVYIRKGQSLEGDGQGTYFDLTGNTGSNSFKLGHGASGADPGGSPVRISNIWTNGGSGSNGAIFTDAQGFSIDSVFMTFPGIGLDISGADGIVSNVEVDQSLAAIVFNGAQNVGLTNVNLYLPRYGFTFNSNCRDITITGGVVKYPQYDAVLFGDSQSNIKAINFSGMNFTMNAQYSTLEALIHKRASNVEVQFTGCSFRNWYQHAIVDGAGINSNMTFVGCIFDGSRTTTAYTQGSTAKVINTGSAGANGVYSFEGCEFRNLFGEIATINDGISLLKIHGGLVQNCPIGRLNVVTTNVPRISIRGVSGFAYTSSNGTHQFAVLPYWGASTSWKVGVKGNVAASADVSYSAAEEAIYSVSWQFDGTSKKMFLDKMPIWKTPTRTIPGDLSAIGCFGSAPGGATSSTTLSQGGTICVAVPTSSAANFDWFADTVCA